jgi:hypothetical protein
LGLEPQPAIRTELKAPWPPLPQVIAARVRHTFGTLTVTGSPSRRKAAEHRLMPATCGSAVPSTHAQPQSLVDVEGERLLKA